MRLHLGGLRCTTTVPRGARGGRRARLARLLSATGTPLPSAPELRALDSYEPLVFSARRTRVVWERDAAERALRALEGQWCLGFDTESWRERIETVQLASATHAVVIRRSALLPSPPRALATLMEDPGVVKVGQRPYRELDELAREFGLEPRGVADVAHVAARAGLRSLNLQAMVAVLLDRRLSKRAQRSNWSRARLSEEQVRYAAADAHVTRQVFLRALELLAAREGADPTDHAGALRLSRALIGDYDSDLDEVAAAAVAGATERAGDEGEPGRGLPLPLRLDEFDGTGWALPVELLGLWCGLKPAARGVPEYEVLEERPEGFLAACHLPRLGVSRSTSHPMEHARGAREFAAFKVLHEVTGGRLSGALARATAARMLGRRCALHGLPPPSVSAARCASSGRWTCEARIDLGGGGTAAMALVARGGPSATRKGAAAAAAVAALEDLALAAAAGEVPPARREGHRIRWHGRRGDA